MATPAELDEDERERAEFRRRSGIPEPKTGRPPLRRTPKGTTYAQGRPHSPAPARATDAPAPAGGRPAPARGAGSVPASTTRTRPITPQATPAPAPGPIRARAGQVGSGAAGVIVGLFVWGFALNFIEGGWAQAAGWFGAKFFNEPYGGPVGSTSGTASTSTPPAPALRRGATPPAPASTTG